MVKQKKFDVGWRWDEEFPLSQVIRVGEWVYISGQIAVDPDGKIVGEGDLRAQTRQVFENIRIVLDQAGASLHDIVKMTTFFTVDIENVTSEYFDVRREFLGDHKPTSTGVHVAGLVYPELLLEVEAVACVGSGARGRQ